LTKLAGFGFPKGLQVEYETPEGDGMKHGISALLLALAATTPAAHAQQSDLNETPPGLCTSLANA